MADTRYQTEPIPAFSEHTRSPIVSELLTVFSQKDGSGPGSALVFPFEGDHDAAHQKTRSWRKTLDRLGFTLRYKNDRSRKCLLMWIVPNRPNHALASPQSGK